MNVGLRVTVGRRVWPWKLGALVAIFLLGLEDGEVDG